MTPPEPLTWTGAAGAVLDPALALAVAGFVLALGLRGAARLGLRVGGAERAVRVAGGLLAAAILAYGVAGVVLPWGMAGIVGAMARQLLPVWVAMGVVLIFSYAWRSKLGLYGRMIGSPIGRIGFGLVLFWALTALAAGALGLVAPHDPLSVVSGLRNAPPGAPVPGVAAPGPGSHYLLGGDALARDVFSRVVQGSWIVAQVAPLATALGVAAGVLLGLPAGYHGGRVDAALSFLANLVLAFPVILLFYLLVTPEILATGLPTALAAGIFAVPPVLVALLAWSRLRTEPGRALAVLGPVLAGMGWLYLSAVGEAGGRLDLLGRLDLFDLPPGLLAVFVSVAFVNAPTVFRLVRGLTLDLRTRDYVAAAQTRGESSWHVMLWEILPNARGPLIVDGCLRIGYTTILLGTLGFFGLGLPPESPDWGSTINAGRRLLSVHPHPAVVPAVALLSLVLGLNLLADALREESLKD
ncbi:ABC transporter permease [Rubellimicrobium aerolatum]|uniref:ABC transporter permease n=1 Tax=Rubellimicrobium aerolatum TaxID=490979 RepID=A0ABW0S8F6_9RHOB|nr:ABC transporter permease [Rubellimicrobium aerolatum]MBP1804242.1 peptide/nickel transport system permease protein [Rubellimicrobium aerolatum]